MAIQFKPASRKQIPMKVAILGPSGSGKTYSALALGSGLGERVALIDTENGSASLYSEKFKFDTVRLDPPFDTSKYLEAIQAAEEAGFDVLIIDSLSHAWAGEGGLLEKKTALDARGGNSYTNWGPITAQHEKLKAKILHSPVHIISCMRSKQAVVLKENDKGKMAPVKVGMEAVQREGIEYEYSIVFDLGMDHSFSVSKDRTGRFDGRMERMEKRHGEELRGYLLEVPAADAEEPIARLSKENLRELKGLMIEKQFSDVAMKSWIQDLGYASGSEIPLSEFDSIKAKLTSIEAPKDKKKKNGGS